MTTTPPVPDSNELVKKITDSEDLIDILMDVEDYLDSNYLYTYKNWLDGEIVDGPKIQKYWITVVLKFEYKSMPDPDGAARLLPHGTRVRYRISKESRPVEVKTSGDYVPGTHKPRLKDHKVWLIEMMIPRKFVKNLTDEVIGLYDEKTDVDTVDNAATNDIQPFMGQEPQDNMDDLGATGPTDEGMPA